MENSEHRDIHNQSTHVEIARVPLDVEGRPTTETPYTYALFKVNRDGPQPVLEFREMDGEDDAIFDVTFLDDPLKGTHKLQLPAHLFHPLSEFAIDEHGLLQTKGDMPAGVAIYSPVCAKDRWSMKLIRIDRNDDVCRKVYEDSIESIARELARDFYENPDYSIYKKPPTDKHEQVEVVVGFRRGKVDKKMSGVIRALWLLGFDTVGSCQERECGTGYVSFFVRNDANKAQSILAKSGIEVELRPKEMKVKNGPDKEIKMPTAHLVFEPESIESIAKSLLQFHESRRVR